MNDLYTFLTKQLAQLCPRVFRQSCRKFDFKLNHHITYNPSPAAKPQARTHLYHSRRYDYIALAIDWLACADGWQNEPRPAQRVFERDFFLEHQVHISSRKIAVLLDGQFDHDVALGWRRRWRGGLRVRQPLVSFACHNQHFARLDAWRDVHGQHKLLDPLFVGVIAVAQRVGWVESRHGSLDGDGHFRHSFEHLVQSDFNHLFNGLWFLRGRESAKYVLERISPESWKPSPASPPEKLLEYVLLWPPSSPSIVDMELKAVWRLMLLLLWVHLSRRIKLSALVRVPQHFIRGVYFLDFLLGLFARITVWMKLQRQRTIGTFYLLFCCPWLHAQYLVWIHFFINYAQHIYVYFRISFRISEPFQNTTKYNTIQQNTIQYNKIQYKPRTQNR